MRDVLALHCPLVNFFRCFKQSLKDFALSRSQKWTQSQRNFAVFGRACDFDLFFYRVFSADSGRDTSRDVVATAVRPKPSRVHARRTWVQPRGLVYQQTSLRKTSQKSENVSDDRKQWSFNYTRNYTWKSQTYFGINYITTPPQGKLIPSEHVPVFLYTAKFTSCS